jgi:hypothetical protein
VISLSKLSLRPDRRPDLRRKQRHTIQGGRSHLAAGLERKQSLHRGNLGQSGVPGVHARAIGCEGSANLSTAQGFSSERAEADQPSLLVRAPLVVELTRMLAGINT